MAAEIISPDAVCVVGISHREGIGVRSRIARDPLSFGPPEWMDDESIGDHVKDLLPRGAWGRGRFPLVHIGS